MSIASLFRNSRSVRSILDSAQKDMMKLFGLTKPTDAQKLRASVYLCIASTALLNDFGGRLFDNLIDEVAKESASLAKPLRMLVGDLANDADELSAIFAAFPADLRLTAAISINGLGALDALYHARVQPLVNEILSHKEGPFGAAGFAAITLAIGILGKQEGDEKAARQFLPSTMLLHELSAKLMKAK